VNISSEVSGKITARNYDIGQLVGSDPFFLIDTTFIDFQIEATRQTLKQLNITMQMKRSRVNYLKKEFDRILELFQRNSTAGSQRDSAEEEFTQAKFEMDSTAVQIAQARTTLAELEERRRRHQISAPQGWSITGIQVEVGEIVQVNTPLASVGDYRKLVVPMALSAAEFASLERLEEPFDALLEEIPIKAIIRHIDPQFDEKTRKINLELEVHGYTGNRRGGLRLMLPLKVHTGRLQVPKAAVINRYENPRVKIKSTGEEISIIVLGESNEHLIIGDKPQLTPGVELASH
jgi:multidrug efflux pump subunit AcrA (membrane-fusion protein)